MYDQKKVGLSNMGSNMAPIMVSRGSPPPPPMGATESDMPWEIGLKKVLVKQTLSFFNTVKNIPKNMVDHLSSEFFLSHLRIFYVNDKY